MSHPYSHYQESAAYLRAQLGEFVPKVALILGSGLGDLAQEVEDAVAEKMLEGTLQSGDTAHLTVEDDKLCVTK